MGSHTIKRAVWRASRHLINLSNRAHQKFYGHKNRSAPTVLIFTDSRGTDVTRYWTNGNFIGSYIYPLMKSYNTTVISQPASHTTLVDFLHYYRRLPADVHFDAIVLHAGVVDFSRRPKSSVVKMYGDKQAALRELFYPQDLQANLEKETGCTYEGEATRSFLSLEMASTLLLRDLVTIPNLIWIGSNRILPNWRGNYWKDRPEDMSIIQEYCDLYSRKLSNAIDLSCWDEETIRRYTSDNVHLTEPGFRFLSSQIGAKLKAMGL